MRHSGAAVEAGRIMLAVIVVPQHGARFFYYLRIMMVFYGQGETIRDVTQPAQGTVAVVIIASVLVIELGIFPEWILRAY
jgi:NADH:ubiquinone oxidoreductase subunit 2 (subunit N)